MAKFIELEPGLVINVDMITQVSRLDDPDRYAVYFATNRPTYTNQKGIDKILQTQKLPIKFLKE